MLASNSDIQAWLAESKIDVNDPLAAKPQVEARRLIRGQLAGVFTALTLGTWTTPDNTPEIIRGIAGRLCAAFIYRSIFSEETAAVPEYAQALYNEAITMLQDIRTGTLVVLDSSDEPIDNSGSVLSFFPTDNAPAFTMGQTFA